MGAVQSRGNPVALMNLFLLWLVTPEMLNKGQGMLYNVVVLAYNHAQFACMPLDNPRYLPHPSRTLSSVFLETDTQCLSVHFVCR